MFGFGKNRAIGKEVVDQLVVMNREYDRLLNVLADVASGKIVKGRVGVNLQDRTWSVEPKTSTVTEFPH